MKLTLKIVLMFFGTMLISVAVSFTVIRVAFGYVFFNGGKLKEAAAHVWLFCNLGGMVLFATSVYFHIIKRIKKISALTREIASGNYDTLLRENGRDEISVLTADFNTMTRELKANEYLNREYIKNVSHEIKTPLSAIKGYAEMIESGALDQQKVVKYASIISGEAEKMIQMSRQMLILSMLESSNIIKKEDEFFPDKQIREVILLMQNEWEAKALTFDVDLSPCQITGNKELTRQIWQNLIYNAIKFSDEGGTVTVKLKKEDKLYFEITNNGIGISEEKRPHIFRQFFAAEGSIDGKNTGIGLSLVKKITEKLGGSISFESEQDKGTTFYIKLDI